MQIYLSRLESALALSVPAFIGFQLVERLYFFDQLVSPVVLLLVPIAFFLLWMVRFFSEYGVERPSSSTLLLFALCGVILGCLLAQRAFLFDRYDLSGRSAIGAATLAGTYAVTWGLIGLSVSGSRLVKSDICAVLVMVGIGLVVLPNLAGGYVNLVALREETGIENLSHLWVSENIVFLFFLSYGLARSYLVKLALLVAVTVFLVAMLGRSSLFFTLAAVCVYELAFGDARGGARKAMIGVGFALLGFAVMLGMQWYYSEPILQKLFFKDGLAADASFEARSQLLSLGLFHLRDQLWIGNPTILATEMGSVGAYIHNILSVWQIFGLFAFILLLLLVFVAVFRMFDLMRNARGSALFDVGAMLMIYSVLSVFTTKHGAFWCLWFAVGFWLGVRKEHACSLVPGRAAVRH